jgi:hypothetical protein
MVGTKEIVTIRLEVEFDVLAGEFQILEEDLRRMPLNKFIEVWGPEKRDSRLMLKVVDIEERDDGSKKAKKKIS